MGYRTSAASCEQRCRHCKQRTKQHSGLQERSKQQSASAPAGLAAEYRAASGRFSPTGRHLWGRAPWRLGLSAGAAATGVRMPPLVQQYWGSKAEFISWIHKVSQLLKWFGVTSQAPASRASSSGNALPSAPGTHRCQPLLLNHISGRTSTLLLTAVVKLPLPIF